MEQLGCWHRLGTLYALLLELIMTQRGSDHFIDKEIAYTACREHDIDFCDYEYDEIPNDLVDWFVDLIGENKDKVPVFYQALMYAKESGGIIQICF